MSEDNLGGNSGSSSLRSPEPVPVSAHSGDDPGRVPPRPNQYDPPIVAAAAKLLAEQVVEEWDNGGDVGEWEKSLAKEMRWANRDGYELARELERYHGISPDSQLVELLDNASSNVWKAHQDAVKAWVAEHSIKAPLAVGTRVECRRGTGEITSIREEEAVYIVLPDAERDDPKFSRGGGWIINYEAAQAIETRSATTENTGVARKGESAVPKECAPKVAP